MHWRGVLVDRHWWDAIWNTVRFSTFSVALETFFGLIVALVLNMRFAGRGLVRAAILIPWAIPTVVSARMWGWMLNDQFGIINHMMMDTGLISEPIAWTMSSDTAMLAALMVDVWKTMPFMALLILATLQMITHDMYYAARIDDIHPLRVFFRATRLCCTTELLAVVPFACAELSHGLCDRGPERGAAVQDGDAALELGSLAIEVPCHKPLARASAS